MCSTCVCLNLISLDRFVLFICSVFCSNVHVAIVSNLNRATKERERGREREREGERGGGRERER